jgi:hypothetical protein
MNKDEYQQPLNESTNQLNNVCQLIQGATPTMTLIQISRREIPNFRKLFHNLPDKTLSHFDFSIVKHTPNTILTIATERFDPTKYYHYMKTGYERFFISYRLRTWSALKPKPVILEELRKKFLEEWRNKSSPNHNDSNSSLNSVASTATAAAAVTTTSDVTTNITHRKLDFFEFFMSSDDICGMALTQSTIYIATKHEITIISSSNQRIIAQYRREGNGRNTFKHISYIYIPSNDETNLYIVDNGQYVVHQYKIDDSGLRFEYVRQYVVIANINQRCNLKSCVIYNNNLYISDSGNNCLHIFPVKEERQSFYLVDTSITPFSPGSLCVYGKYLYVANCSAESPSILVLNEECEPVDWFRNKSLQQILSIDIDPNINQLFVLTTTMAQGENNELKKLPLIVSMDLKRSENS